MMKEAAEVLRRGGTASEEEMEALSKEMDLLEVKGKGKTAAPPVPGEDALRGSSKAEKEKEAQPGLLGRTFRAGRSGSSGDRRVTRSTPPPARPEEAVAAANKAKAATKLASAAKSGKQIPNPGWRTAFDKNSAKAYYCNIRNTTCGAGLGFRCPGCLHRGRALL